MGRFLSNAIMKIDKKGRVSIPAPFRSVLQKAEETSVYTLLALDRPVVNAGGEAWLQAQEAVLIQLDPMSDRYAEESFVLHGDGAFVKLDDTGRMVLPDSIRAHAQIQDAIAFVGRGQFFQMWEPERFHVYREEVRKRVQARRIASQDDR